MSKLSQDKVWRIRFQLEINTRIITYETKIRIFQYKLLNNVLHLDKKLFLFGRISQSKYSFCEWYEETPQYIFYECTFAQNLWTQVWLYLSDRVALPILNSQSAIFGFPDALDSNYLLVNHLLLIFKYSVYNSRVNNTLSFQSIKCAIFQTKYIETISENDLNKKRKLLKKWNSISSSHK